MQAYDAAAGRTKGMLRIATNRNHHTYTLLMLTHGLQEHDRWIEPPNEEEEEEMEQRQHQTV